MNAKQKRLIIECIISFILIIVGVCLARLGSEGYYVAFAGCILLAIFIVVAIITFWKETDHDADDGIMDMVSHIILSILTFNIWNVYWYYKTTKYFNKAMPDQYHKDPMLETILCILVPYYHIYWTYLIAKNIETINTQKGKHVEVVIPALIIAICFFWWGDSIFLQYELNLALEDKTPAPIQEEPKTTEE